MEPYEIDHVLTYHRVVEINASVIFLCKRTIRNTQDVCSSSLQKLSKVTQNSFSMQYLH